MKKDESFPYLLTYPHQYVQSNSGHRSIRSGRLNNENELKMKMKRNRSQVSLGLDIGYQILKIFDLEYKQNGITELLAN